MDQYLNSQRTALLWDLLANPADKDALHTQNLQDLVNEYPQSGLLQALLTYVGDTPNLQRAAVYCNPKVLYKLNRDIEDLHAVSTGQILAIKTVQPMAGYFHVGEIAHETALPVNDLPPLVPDAAYEALQQPEPETLQVDANAPVIQPGQKTVTAPELTDKPVHEEIAAPAETQNLASPEPAVKTEEKPSIEEDTYDEIVSIDDINLAVQEYYASVMEPQAGKYEPAQFSDIYAEALKTDYEPTPIVEANFFPANETPDTPATSATPPAEQVPAEPVAETREETVFKDRKVDLNDEAEKLILNNIAATDFFVFDRAFGDKAREPQQAPVETQHIAPPSEPISVEAQHLASPELEAETPVSEVEKAPVAKPNPYENIAKYHDEKMPYSFMWWLDKTRREHSGIYQPFVEFKLDTTRSIRPAETIQSVEQPDELQQQYIESIFQLNTVEELEGIEQEPVLFDPKKKEDEIIERFIHDVPQIRPQAPDKLDNENKARKSSEDQDELVTETLAQIYIDQMLYPKAIATYKKLMLKFPEKSRYFAGQIEALQKK